MNPSGLYGISGFPYVLVHLKRTTQSELTAQAFSELGASAARAGF